jgi:hypothetical protein
MLVAILSTKVPILLGEPFWIFRLPRLDRYGFWSMEHEARTDFAMLLGSRFLLIIVGGRLTQDSRETAEATPHR